MNGAPAKLHRLTPAAIALAAALLILAAQSAAAQDPTRAAERGELLYRVHCASCHGEDGAGGGPVAEVLEVPPTDLTGLAADDDGDFPEEEVRRSIDGRGDVTGHGRREMPVWGLTFQQPGRDTDQEAEVRGRIDDLLAYLRSIQRTEEDAPVEPKPEGGDGGEG